MHDDIKKGIKEASHNEAPDTAREDLRKKLDLIIEDKMETLMAVTAPLNGVNQNSRSAQRSPGSDRLLNLHENIHGRFKGFGGNGHRNEETCEAEFMRTALLDSISLFKTGDFISMYLRGLNVRGFNVKGSDVKNTEAEIPSLRKSSTTGFSDTSFSEAHEASLRELRKGAGEITNELEFINHTFLRKLLLSYNHSEQVVDESPMRELLYSRPELIRNFQCCPIPLCKIAHLKSIYLLTERNKALGYLYLLFNNLNCTVKEFTSDTGKPKRLADGMPNDNFIRYFMLRAMTGEGFNITSAADFINRDLPDMYHHYMIRNRRYHLAKYGMKKFVTRNSGRRKEDEAITRQASSARLNRLSLFTAIHEMLTDRHGSSAPVLNEASLITSVMLYRQSMKFLKTGISEAGLTDDAERAAVLIRNTAQKHVMSRNLNEKEIREALIRASSRIRHRITELCINAPVHDVTDKEKDSDETDNLKTSAEDFLKELDGKNAFHVFSAEMKGADAKSREALSVMKRDSYSDAVSAHGFAYKSFTNSSKLPLDTMHRYLSREDRQLIKKELFCQSRDKGRL